MTGFKRGKKMVDVDIIVWKIIGCAAIVTVNILGVFLPIFYAEWFFVKNGISNFNCFIAGILFATASTQMLSESEVPPSIDNDGPQVGFPIVHFVFSVGFFLTLVSQWLIEGIKRHRHNSKALQIMRGITDISILPDKKIGEDDEITVESYSQSEEEQDAGQPSLLTIIAVFTFGSILTGCAIGVEDSSGSVIVLSLSASATDWIESVLFAMSICNSQKNAKDYKMRAVKYAIIYTIVSVMAVVIPVIIFTSVVKVNVMREISSGIMALLAGSFTYITCVDILAKEIHGIKITGGYPGLRELVIKLSQFAIGLAVVNAIVFFQM